jgi:dTDP-4-dehydrorhamnose 3,5-epimerase
MTKFAELEDFKGDTPWTPSQSALGTLPGKLEGVLLSPLIVNADKRGHLVELMTESEEQYVPPVHIYHVFAEPGSVRAWVYHKRQHDRLHFAHGQFRVVLFDLRPESSTYHQIEILDVGRDNPCRLVIPPFVAHGVQNSGTELASFVNMPTRSYNHANPDKSRIPANHPGIPYSFE